LNGHVDDAERSLAQPLVSLSLGCDAIFLLGGTTKEVAPTALLLRSGDAVVLSGEARRCYHGVPRVLTDRPLPPALRCGEAGGGGSAAGGADDGGGGATEGDPFAPFERHMRCCRINISIRDTR
jgi:alkylated DNA repair protein alkB family protein 1